MKTLLVVCVVAAIGAAGCSMLPMGRDLGEGLGGGLSDKADTIGSSLMRGVRDTLTSAHTRRQLDTLLEAVGTSLAEQARKARDTLLGAAARAWVEQIRDSLMGAHTRTQLAALRNELLGAATRANLAALRTELLGDSTQRLVGAMRNQLLGTDTKAEIGSIVDTAMIHLATQFGTNVRPLLQQELTFVQRNATTLLFVVGFIACGVAGYIYFEKQKTLKLLRTMTFQIHNIPDQHSYDELVGRIQRSAQETGLEPRLRKILERQGILGKEGWRSAA